MKSSAGRLLHGDGRPCVCVCGAKWLYWFGSLDVNALVYITFIVAVLVLMLL